MAKRKIQVDPQAVKATASAIQKYRKLRGLTQAELAALVDIEPATMSRLETGKRPVSMGILQSLAAALTVPVSELIEAGGEARGEDQEERELLALWRMLDDDAKRALWLLMNRALPRP